MSDFEKLRQAIAKFTQERNWDQFFSSSYTYKSPK